MDNHAVEACLKGLQAKLVAISGLTVKNEWPRPAEKLVMPSVTMLSGDCPFTPQMVSRISTSGVDGDGKVTVVECYGQHEFKMQLDLWCATKFDRDKYMGLILNALNPTPTGNQGASASAGLSIQLTSYYNEWAHFYIDRQKYVDDEAAAQRQERRATVELIGNCRAIRSRLYYAIAHVEVELGVGENLALTNDLTDTVPVQVGEDE